MTPRLVAITMLLSAVFLGCNTLKPVDEKTAYSKIKPFSISDLRAFIAAFPTGDQRASVEQSISLLTTLDAIRSGSMQPKCTIPFSALGHWKDSSAWDYYRRVSPRRGALALLHEKGAEDLFVNPIVRADTPAVDSAVFSSTAPTWLTAPPAPSFWSASWPTGEGSIWGVESDGVAWFPGLAAFNTQGMLVLGVIYNRGLVCLSGTGTLILMDENGRKLSEITVN